ncbi:PREDICTED: uncharacterized protein LOC104819775 [Tarenaya hassleriana]|uniref:uncharacterized protein LOC104819775 n=1 Tax=Tarenaya hassleriana TaxID=28532 RepID=UPI00053C905C|nr:PREDICTED: uncharacterized protein LOC104819775 [Tarenaya hassleriana]
MLRALSTRARSRHGYERLGDESSIFLKEGELKRSRTVPTWLSSNPPRNKLGRGSVPAILEELPRQKSAARKKTKGKFSHPIFSLFEGLYSNSSSRKKKTTAKPEFSRYLEYLKEGGMWDPRSNMPVIYFK